MRWNGLVSDSGECGISAAKYRSHSQPRERRNRLLHNVLAVAFALAALFAGGTKAQAALLGTSTAVVSTPNPSGLGQTVTFTATVTGVVVSPSGSVTLKDGATTIGSGTLSASGLGQSQATITASFNTAGPHTITAVYSGDGGYFPSTSPNYTHNVNVSATTTAVQVDLNPITLGQLVTISADVTGCVATPVGTVTFKNGTNILGTGVLNAGHAVFSSSSLLTGLLPITAVFAGDTNCAGSTSNIVNLRVNLGLASASVASSQNPSSYNQSVTFTATVSGIILFTPTGNVTFKDNGNSLGTVALNGSGTATLTTSALTVGSHSITVDYGGDSLYGTTTSPTLTQTVNKAATSTSLVVAPNPSAFGQSVTYTATVTSSAGTPTGTVTFKDGATTIGTGTLNGSGVATVSVGTLTGGTHSITAVYAGDTNFLTSTSSATTQTVNKNTTTAALVSGTNPSAYGGAVTFTATVSGSGGTPTGTVTFKDGATTLGNGSLNGAGVASFTTSALTAGTHSITAVYGGDGNFLTTTSSAVSQVVNQNATTTSLVASPNPSTFGQSVTFTATVAGAGGTPTGTVTFKDGATTLGTITLNGSGVAAFSTSALGSATHSITATYNGDTNFLASVSSTVSQVVGNGTTGITLSSAPNPSALSQNVTFTATVSGAGGTPTGTVTFKEGVTTLGNGTLNGAGQATFSTAALSAGSHTITAAYGGDSNNAASTSSPVTQVVGQSSTTTALVSSNNPSAFGQAVTFTATVSGSGGTPTGTVTFKEGAATLGSASLDGAGQAAFTTSGLSTGSHSVTAVYSGDGNFTTSTSPVLTQSVGAGTSSIALASAPNPSALGQAVTFTATVSSAGTAATGTVTFKDGGTTLGTGALDGSGHSTFVTSALTAGTHSITAVYGGDGNFTTSTSSPLLQSVGTGASSTSLVSSANPSALGQTVTFTVTVNGSGAIPTGTVTLKDNGTTVGTQSLSGGQTAFSLTPTAGTHTITADYNGDGNYSTSSAAPLSHVVNQGASTTTLAALPNPSSFGQSVTFTATVSGSGATPTGTMTFKEGATTLTTVTLGGGGQAMFSTNALSAGAHTITATYNGDSNFTTSTSAPVTQAVTTTSSATTLASSANPSAAGQTVTFTATVSGTGSNPTGTVTFKDGAATLGTGTLTAGQATYTTSSLTGGAHSITALYGGDGNFTASSSAPLTQTVNANASSTTMTSSANPSLFGQLVTYTATVTGGAGTPTGTATFRDGSTVLGTVPLDGAGQARYGTSSLGGGPHTMTATYNGSPTYGASTSAPLSQSVSQNSSSVSLCSSINPSSLNQSVTFTATVSGTGATPSGSVAFKDGPATLGTGILDSSGAATFTTSALTTGSHTITAVYGGDANFTVATSPAYTQNVSAFGSTTTLTSNPNPSASNETVTFTVTVGGSGGPPTGTVTLKEGAVVLGTGTLSGGKATFARNFAVGKHVITAFYGGDSQFSASNSAPLTQSIGVPIDSQRLRAFQIATTKLVAQSSGQAISGAMESAVSEGFDGDDELIRPSENGLRFNLSAEPRNENYASAAFNELGLRRGDMEAQQKADDTTATIRSRHPKEILAWTDVRGIGWTGNISPQADIQGTQTNALAGITFRINPYLLIGFLGGFENFDYTSRSLGGKLTGSGMTAGAYAGWKLRSGIRVDGGIARTSLDYDAAVGTASGGFSATRWLFTGGVTGTEKLGRGMTLEPSLRVYALREEEESYIDSLGTPQGLRTFTTGRASAGARMSYLMPATMRGMTISPYVGLYGDYYFSSDPEAAQTVLQLAELQGWSARFTSGLTATAGGASATIGGEYGGIGGDGPTMWSIKGRTSIPF